MGKQNDTTWLPSLILLAHLLLLSCGLCEDVCLHGGIIAEGFSQFQSGLVGMIQPFPVVMSRNTFLLVVL